MSIDRFDFVANSRRYQSIVLQKVNQLVDQTDLPCKDFLPRHWNWEPCGAINFGELAGLAGFGRPFQRKSVAAKFGRIAVRFDDPRENHFAAALLYRVERAEFAVDSETGFFDE